MSLFDVADAVFESKSLAPYKPSSAPAALPPFAPGAVPTLFLLDETLQHLHNARDRAPVVAPKPVPSTWQYKSTRDTSASATSGPHHEAGPLRRVFSNSLLDMTSPPTTKEPDRPDPKPADAVARSALKAAMDECEAYDRTAGDPATALSPQDFAQTLEKKYIEASLAGLPETAFVVLARKKIKARVREYAGRRERDAGQLEAFGDEIRAALNSLGRDQSSNQTTHTHGDSLSAHVDAVAKVTSVPTPSQGMLEKLLALPKSQLEKLPKAQQELVAFTRRYQQAMALTPDQVAQLPAHQQALVAQLRAKGAPR
ncbi:hypothetical protein ACHHYP_05691 [Achlya hypogyna]|uniref:Uncharacterized protein n=1 Tax=Achlya hypogyna TaxID=1202772 RepID=A0A1V9YX91_ACHHY|nr:hypothetical protein ACHHYP_05691 [Achlya hypogyna]